MNKDSQQKTGSNQAPTHATKHTVNHDAGQGTGQNFQKFAAQLVSPSEVFEPRSARHRVNIPESLELLGSLASLTRSSLVQASAIHAALAAGNSGANSDTSTLSQSPSSSLFSNHGSNHDPSAKTSNGIQYETSRKEYRQALEDQRIAEALSQLQTHRENTQRARIAQANARAHTGHRSGAVIHQPPSQRSGAGSNSALNSTSNAAPNSSGNAAGGFQYASLPEVSVSAKPSPMRKSPGAYQTILRPFNPQNKS